MRDTKDTVKMIAAKDKSRLSEVCIIGPNAGDLIMEAATAMSGMFTVKEAAGTMHGHPTLSETFGETIPNLLRKAIHMPPVKNR